MNLLSFSDIALLFFYNFGFLLLDLISKMASMKGRKLEFEVSITVTSISMIVSLSTTDSLMLLPGVQRLIAFYLVKSDYVMYAVFVPNTLKWIVVQKILVHFANKHNELMISNILMKLREKRQRQQVKKLITLVKK